jgi:predicted HTH domain antitoxin
MILELPEISGLRRFSAEDLRLELACALYARERLGSAAGAELAGLDLVGFQKALHERGIVRQYSIEDLDEDMKTLEKLFPA